MDRKICNNNFANNGIMKIFYRAKERGKEGRLVDLSLENGDRLHSTNLFLFSLSLFPYSRENTCNYVESTGDHDARNIIGIASRPSIPRRALYNCGSRNRYCVIEHRTITLFIRALFRPIVTVVSALKSWL